MARAMSEHRDNLEHMLVALQVADTWVEDPATAQLAASTIGPVQLAAGLVSLVRTLRRNLATQCGITVDQVNAAVRHQTLIEIGQEAANPGGTT